MLLKCALSPWPLWEQGLRGIHEFECPASKQIAGKAT